MPLIFFISLYVFLAFFGLMLLSFGSLFLSDTLAMTRWNAVSRRLLYITGFITICLGFLTLIIAVVSTIIGAPAS
jgi:hypothetical protein